MAYSELLWLAAQAAATVALPMPAFLTGCHEERREARWTEECWTVPRGGLMLGSGRSGSEGKIADWEWMRIERGADGVPVFYGSPRGAPPVAFKAVSASATEIVFANPAHDFPQRVRYARTAKGIEAEVSLLDGSKATRWTFGAMGAPG